MTDEFDVQPEEMSDEDSPESSFLDREAVMSALDALGDDSDPVVDIEAETDLETELAESVTQTVDPGQSQEAAESGEEMTTFGEAERLRQPRAQHFRRRLQNQISMFPLALFLIGLGGYLFARQQDIGNLPDFSTPTLAGAAVLAAAFAAVFHALLSGRRERGLLFIGLWVWVTAGGIAVLVYAVDDHPDVTEWWPLLIGTLGLTLLVTAVIERTHDARLIWLGLMILVAAGTAYWITSGQIAEQYLSDATDYWPLLFSVIGIGLLPLVFRRTGQG
jgi:hypothetical protein